MKTKSSYHPGGFSLIEMMVVVAIIAIPLLAVGILAAGGAKSFRQTYDSIHKEIREDAAAAMTAFGTVGRKSNRSNYKVYKISSGLFNEAQPSMGQDIAFGQAVEFRYWEKPFDPANPGSNVLEVTNTGTHYALFYLDGKHLKIDYGTVVNGMGAIAGKNRNTASLKNTVVLSRHVDPVGASHLFQHTVIGGVGMGSVRMNLVLVDEEAERVELKTSVLLRLNWPR